MWEYQDLIQQCELLGHMKLVDQNYINSYENEQCFLPNHAVIKPSSTLTKL